MLLAIRFCFIIETYKYRYYYQCRLATVSVFDKRGLGKRETSFGRPTSYRTILQVQVPEKQKKTGAGKKFYAS